ncbi:hypothetical protein RAD15_04540 [Bradyrhizobium sp. 14AA]
MEKLRELFTFVCFGLGAISLLLCVFQGWHEKYGSASILLVTGIMCGVFVFLSQVKTFKVWEVQVELKEQLDQAQMSIAQLRRISMNSAKAIYSQLAWGNRMASPTAKEKKAQLDEIEKQLLDLNLASDEREDVVRPIVRIIGFDLYQIFSRTIEAYGGLRYTALVERARSEQPAFVGAREKHSEGYTKWVRREGGQNPFERLYTYDMKAELERETPRPSEWMDEEDLEITRRFAQDVLRIYTGCVMKGGYTTEAADFLDKYSKKEDFEAKANELYARPLTELRKP